MSNGDLAIIQGVDLEFIASVDYEGPLHRADTVIVTDEVTLTMEYVLVFDDSVTVSDSPDVSPTLIREIDDSVTVTDSVEIVAELYLTIDDSVTMDDAVVASLGGLISQSLADSVTMSDSVAFARSSETTVADSVTMSDSVAFTRDIQITVNDSVSMTDVITPGDPYWAGVNMLLHGEGYTDRQNNLYVDSSPNALAVTGQGTPLQGGVSPYQAQGGSAFLGQTGGGADFLQVANSSGFNFGSGDFCVECWVYPVTPIAATQVLVSHWNQNGGSNNEWLLFLNSGVPTLSVSATGSAVTSTATGPAIRANYWNHIAAQRSAGFLQVYVNGIPGSNVSYGTALAASTEVLGIGWIRNGGSSSGASIYPYTGYIAGLRINKGAALYGGGSFVPPTAPVDGSSAAVMLHMTNAGVVDSARRYNPLPVGGMQSWGGRAKWGASSLVFSGSTAYMQAPYPASAMWEFGTADFTVETWFLLAGNSPVDGSGGRTATLFSNVVPGSGRGWNLIVGGDANTTGVGWIIFSNDHSLGSQYLQYNLPAALTHDQWYHVAVSRVGTTTRMFLDGVLVASITFTNQGIGPFSGAYMWLGRSNYGTYERNLNGYMDDARITKGYGRYSATFPAPTGPFADGLPTGIPEVPVEYIASGAALNTAAIPVSTSGASVGDLIILNSPHGPGTPGGSGWTTISYSWSGGGYSAAVWWKVLDSTADIVVTSDTYSTSYAIYRGVTSVARVIADELASTSHAVTWPTPNPTCKAQLMMVHQQSATVYTPASGFTERYDTQIGGVFRYEVADRFVPAAGGSTIGAAATANYINGLELRG